MGLVTIIYFAEEAYSNGFVALVAGLIITFTMWLIGPPGFVISHLRNLNIRTVPEYLRSFRPGIRWIAGVAHSDRVLNMGIFSRWKAGSWR
jgi:hypothetical protein